jgi:hypothetical protein
VGCLGVEILHGLRSDEDHIKFPLLSFFGDLGRGSGYRSSDSALSYEAEKMHDEKRCRRTANRTSIEERAMRGAGFEPANPYRTGA